MALSCLRCRQPAFDEPELVAAGRKLGIRVKDGTLYANSSDAPRAHELENRKGFECIQCDNIYCMGCLLAAAPPHKNGGKACIACRGTLRRLLPRAGIGIVFNVDELGGGDYGTAAWRILMRALPPEYLIGCSLKQGDTRTPSEGSSCDFCIALLGIGYRDAVVREAFENTSARGLAPLAHRIISRPALDAEPLMDAGYVDPDGRLVQEEWSRIFHDLCRESGWGFAPAAVTVELTPELQAELDGLRATTAAAESRATARSRAELSASAQREIERKRREEEEKERAVRRAAEEKEREARRVEVAKAAAENAARQAGVRAARRSAGQCTECGESLGFADSLRLRLRGSGLSRIAGLLGRDRHRACTYRG